MWLVLGWTFVGLGAIGLVLPLMPTVPFLIVAAYCFERGSPKLHRWILNHPQFGPPLIDWRSHRVIRWPAKLIATAGLLCSCSYTVVATERPPSVKWTVAVIGTLAIIFILSRRSKPSGL